jgi:2,4-dienoyl-CoA reductase-like NADH-dependent reductase (Old Yellow Enzyme family)/thioredoxin reductase
MTLTRVYEPIQVGPVEIKNRIVRTAHGTALSVPRELFGGPDLIAYHVARAKGGVGLTIFEAMAVHPSSGSLTMSDEQTVERYGEVVEAIRPYRMRAFQQLFHQGYIGPTNDGGVPWAVSAVSSICGTVGAPMTKGQIDEIVRAFAAAAGRCRDGGLDGIELHAAHGYLPAQFLSPILNTRTDEYGGSFENRLRITQEILRAIRAEVGDGMAVGVRLSASRVPGNVTEDELRRVIQTLEQEGLIDFLTTSWSDHYHVVSILAAMDSPAGYELVSSGQLTAAATVPSIVTGRFRTLEEAERVLEDGVADMVSMVRALIADPEIVRKTQEGRADEIRPCIACNQGCQGGVARFPQRMGCIVNPAAGFERTLSEELIAPVESPRKVLVVGGGPAGLEAARVAALCGHEVTLVEASSQLGGALNVATRSPRFALLGDIVGWLASAVERAGVTVELDSLVSADDVTGYGADTVVVATGSTPRMDGLQPAWPAEPARGVDQPHVLSSHALLTGGLPDGAASAVVLDTVGHFEAIAAAQFLAGEGAAITFVTSLASFGGLWVISTGREVPALEHLYEGDFTLLTRHHLVEIAASTCVVRPLESKRTREVPADVVVLVTQNEPNRGLYDELVAAGQSDVLIVGDAASPRDLQVAIAEGHRVARGIPAAAAAAVA